MVSQSPHNVTAIGTEASARATRPLLTDVTGSGDPIVLVPGALTGWASWVAHAERLAEEHQVIRVQVRNVELPEAGLPLPETYSIQTEIDGLLRAVDHLGLDRFDLVGWSLGGVVSLGFAMEHPDRVKTLTLIEPAANGVLAAAGLGGPWLAGIEKQDRALSGKEVSLDDLKAFLQRAGVGAGDVDIASHPRWPLMVQNRQAISVVGVVWDYAVPIDQLRALSMPLLMVMGRESPDDVRLIARTIEQHVPNAVMLELPGDHTCHIQHIDAFLQALETHLRQEG